MNKDLNNFAFIDSQNLNLGIRDQEWKLDFKKFRIYLKDKYGVSKAYIFIGYIEGNRDLYTSLQDFGYICVFKPTLKYKDGTTKGNCDAELVLQSMIEYENYNKAIIITGDGDFHCLVHYLIGKNKLEALIIPNKLRFSALLKMSHIKTFLRYMNDLKNKLSYTKEKTQ